MSQPLLLRESLVGLSELAAGLPSRRAGKRLHVATLRRWARRGLRGVRLEVVRIGDGVFTSREAWGRFVAATERRPAAWAGGPPKARTPARFARDQERATATLRAAGILP